MFKRSGQSIMTIITALLFMGIIIFAYFSRSARIPIVPLLLVIAPILIIVTIVNTDIALIILILSMLLSPEFEFGDVSYMRKLVLRTEDILILIVFFSWLAKMAINKQLGLLKYTPINRIIFIYILIFVISGGIAVLAGKSELLNIVFYSLKYGEYFMLYFLVVNNIRDKRQMKTFIVALLLTGVIVSTYGMTQIGRLDRTTAPFEVWEKKPTGEANTFGGYLVFLFALSFGLFLYSKSPAWKLFSAGLACFTIPPFLHTFSRGSYIAFIFMFLAFAFLSKKNRLLLIGAVILGIIILPKILPMGVVSRITSTFQPGVSYEPIAGTRITLDDSAAARVRQWSFILEKWKKRPFFGYGPGGLGLVETHYARVLGETGIVGFAIFIWLFVTIFKRGLYAYNNIEDDWTQGLALGFLTGLIGLLFHSFSASTFILVRIMEPFWFLTAIVIMLPEIYQSSGSDDNKEAVMLR